MLVADGVSGCEDDGIIVGTVDVSAHPENRLRGVESVRSAVWGGGVGSEQAVISSACRSRPATCLGIGPVGRWGRTPRLDWSTMDKSAMRSYDSWIGRDAYDVDGDKLGEITDIFYDDNTQRPEWLTVKTGLFGSRKTFVPLQGSTRYGEDDDDLQVAYDKDFVKDAPKVDVDEHLMPEQEAELWQYYGYDYANADDTNHGYGQDYSNSRADKGFASNWREDWAQDGTGTDAGMTRSEEELRVATERQQTGRVRLRKYVTTEQQQVTVPVQKETVRVEREPITEANRAQAMSGPDIKESEHEIVTHEERPVVSKQTVPKERVRLEKEVVTEDETVSGEVRKEQIAIEDDTNTKGRTR